MNFSRSKANVFTQHFTHLFTTPQFHIPRWEWVERNREKQTQKKKKKLDREQWYQETPRAEQLAYNKKASSVMERKRQWHPTPVLLPGESHKMEEPGRLQSMGSLRVRHNWATSLSLFTFMCWRRKWQPTPVFLSGESQAWGSLVGCHLCCCTESDTTGVT